MGTQSKKNEIVKTVSLDSPIQLGEKGTPVEKLEFRKLRARHMRALPAEGLKFGHMLELMERLTGIDGDLLDELEAADLAKGIEVVSDFLKPFQSIGLKTSGDSP